MLVIDEIIVLALRSIWRNKSRSILTMLGIIIGVSSVILLVSLGQGLQSYVSGAFEKLGSNIVYVIPGKISGEGGGGLQGFSSFMTSKLSLKYVSGLAKLGGPIEDVGADLELPSIVKYKGKSKYGSIVSVTGNYSRITSLEVSSGRNINDSDVNLSRKVVAIGKDIATTLFGQTDPIGKDVTIGEQKFLVVGVLEDMGAAGIGAANDHNIIPITTGQKLFGVDYIQTMSIKARSEDYIPATKKLAENYLKKYLSTDDFSVIDSSTLLSTINQILGVLTAALGGIAAISLVVGGVGIMNIMLVSVTERTHEIGLRKAVGAKPNDILIQFLIEAIVLSSFGGTIGILVGSLGAGIANHFFPTSVSFWSVGLAFGVSALVGIVFGVAPAIRASRLNPIEALRYE